MKVFAISGMNHGAEISHEGEGTVKGDYVRVNGELLNRAFVFTDTEENRKAFAAFVARSKERDKQQSDDMYSTLRVMTRPYTEELL